MPTCRLILGCLALLPVLLGSAQAQDTPAADDGALFHHYFQQRQEEGAAEALPEPPPSNPVVGEFFQRILGGNQTQAASSEEAAAAEGSTEGPATGNATTEGTAEAEAGGEAAPSPQAALEQDILQMFDALRLFGSAEYALMTVEPREARISGITLTLANKPQSVIVIDEMVLSDYAYLGDILQAGQMRISGIHLPVNEELFEQDAQDLKDMGYDELIADLALTFHYWKSDSTFTLDDFSLNVRDMGSLALSFTLGGVDLENAMNVPPESLQVVRAELRYQDASLMNRLFEVLAGEEQMTLEDFKNQGVQELDQEITQARAQGDEFSAAAYEEFKKFILQPYVLRLTLAPEQPVTFAQLGETQGPDEAITLLNMVVAADQP